MNCEVHITLHRKHIAVAERMAEKHHWKTSEIARDPVMGEDTFLYLTTHAADFPKAWEKMMGMFYALEELHVPMLRFKIELVLFDNRGSNPLEKT